MVKNISLGIDGDTEVAPVSHRAPSMVRPFTYEPSFVAWSTSSADFFVTSHATTTLSSGQSFLRACACRIAVRNDLGLKNPDSQATLGNIKSAVKSCSCLRR